MKFSFLLYVSVIVMWSCSAGEEGSGKSISNDDVACSIELKNKLNNSAAIDSTSISLHNSLYSVSFYQKEGFINHDWISHFECYVTDILSSCNEDTYAGVRLNLLVPINNSFERARLIQWSRNDASPYCDGCRAKEVSQQVISEFTPSDFDVLKKLFELENTDLSQIESSWSNFLTNLSNRCEASDNCHKVFNALKNLVGNSYPHENELVTKVGRLVDIKVNTMDLDFNE